MGTSLSFQLYVAVSDGDIAAVERLLAAGADPNVSLSADEYIAWSDLVSIRRTGKPAAWDEFMLRLFKSGYKPEEDRGYFPIFSALDDANMLKRLLAAGTRVDVREALSGNTPLHDLAINFYRYDHSYEITPLLLDAGAPLETWNNEGLTPLQAGCIQKSDGSLLSALLAKSASVHARSRDGNTALHLAGFWDEGYLPWRGDEAHRDSYSGPYEEDEFEPVTVLWSAREAVNALVDAGADPNAVNPNNGYTPMHWASVHHGYPYLEFLEALFERGGNPGIPNHKGDRPLDMYLDAGDEAGDKLRRRFLESL